MNRETPAADTIPVQEGAVMMSIGRAEGNDFLLNHSSISGTHARIERSGTNGVELVDCNSSNGTFVNGIRIERKDIHPGDVVKFAFLAYRVVESVEEVGENGPVSEAPQPAEPAPGSDEREPVGAQGQESSDETKGAGSHESGREDLRTQDAEIEARWLEERKASEALAAKGRELQAEVESLRTRLANSESQMRTAEKDLEESRQAGLSLQARVEEQEARLAREEKARAEGAASIRSLESELEGLRTRHAEIEASWREEQTARETSEAKVRERNVEIEALRVRLTDSESETAAAEQALEEARQEKVSLQKRIDEVTEMRGRVSEEAAAEKARREQLETDSAKQLREIQSLTEQLEKARETRREREAEILERDRRIATLEFEAERQSRQLATTEERVRSLEGDCTQWRDAYEALKESLAVTSTQLEGTQGNLSNTAATLEDFRVRFRGFLDQLHHDWAFWRVEAGPAGEGDPDSPEACFARAESLRLAMRKELDEVEPIWKKFGKRVQVELEEQVAALEPEIGELDREAEEKCEEVASLTRDVRGLREEVDVEVRRAQGRSRRGVQIEIPERFEAMVIAKDRERQILLALVNQLEFLERLTDGYRRSRKLREVVYELEEFAKRVIAILEENGVEEFTVEPSSALTLKQRKEVQILGKKGWGTREYGEQPFQPGIVKKVIRTGYRAGQGEGSVLLRKVEVLIREVES